MKVIIKGYIMWQRKVATITNLLFYEAYFISRSAETLPHFPLYRTYNLSHRFKYKLNMIFLETYVK